MQRMTFAGFAALLLLASCDQGLPQESVGVNSVSARIDGRVFHARGDDRFGVLPREESVRIETTDSGFNLVAIHRRLGCQEIVQIWLYPFVGAGTYPLFPDTTLARSPRGGAVVACLDSSATYWAFEYPSAHDTAFVTAYDSVTGRIEGSFHFVGVREGTADSVPVTDGVFEGTARPYQPSH